MKATLLMPFIGENDDPKYVRGVECGLIWKCLENGEVFNTMFHSSNIDQMHLVCEHFGCEYDISPVDETWSELIVTQNPATGSGI